MCLIYSGCEQGGLSTDGGLFNQWCEGNKQNRQDVIRTLVMGNRTDGTIGVILKIIVMVDDRMKLRAEKQHEDKRRTAPDQGRPGQELPPDIVFMDWAHSCHRSVR